MGNHALHSAIIAKLTTELKKEIVYDMMKLSIEFKPKSSNWAKCGELWSLVKTGTASV